MRNNIAQCRLKSNTIKKQGNMVKIEDAYKWNKNLFWVENNPERVIGKLLLEEQRASVSIIGVDKVLSREVTLGRRALWIASLLLCCSLVAYYVTSRVIYILSMPTQVAVALQQNDSLVLPDITICTSPMLVESKRKTLGLSPEGAIEQGSLFGDDNVSGDKMWRAMAPGSDYIAVTLVNLENSRLNWRAGFTTMGLCLRHHYDGAIQASGLNFGLQIKIDWSKLRESSPRRSEGLKLFIHPWKDEALTEIEGIFIAPGEDVSIAIRVKEFQSLNRTSNPCIYSSIYSKAHCVNNCFSRELSEYIQCTLPFMRSNNGPESLNPCSTKEYNHAMLHFHKQRQNVSLWATCGQKCLIECNKVVYTPFVESVAPSVRNVSKLVLYFPEMSYEIVKEKEAYDLIALLCDVGGTFGLFLGSSILTLVEILEFIFTFFNLKRVKALFVLPNQKENRN